MRIFSGNPGLIGVGLQAKVYVSERGDTVKKVPWFGGYDKIGLAYLRSYSLGIARIPDFMPQTSIIENQIHQEKVNLLIPLMRGVLRREGAAGAARYVDSFVDLNRSIWERGLTLSFDARFLNCGYRDVDFKLPLVLDAGRMDDKLTAWSVFGVITAHVFNVYNLLKLDLLSPLQSMKLACYYAGKAYKNLGLFEYIRLLGHTD
ncbi:MAG: hypothetical protein AABZ57_08545 [Candidatus Margulisiibacteriota bacterium]